MVPALLLESIREQAKKRKKAVVLPDALDERTLRAVRILLDEGLANPILIGDEDQIRSKAKQSSIDLGNTRIIDPVKSE